MALAKASVFEGSGEPLPLCCCVCSQAAWALFICLLQAGDVEFRKGGVPDLPGMPAAQPFDELDAQDEKKADDSDSGTEMGGDDDDDEEEDQKQGLQGRRNRALSYLVTDMKARDQVPHLLSPNYTY